MTMTDKQRAAIERVRKLLVKTEEAGCTRAEALEAARLARLILEKHELSLSDVEKLQDEGADADAELFDPDAYGLGDVGRVAWREMLARIIARAHGCEILVFDGHSHVLFVGREVHRKTVAYLYAFLCRTATRLASEAFQAAVLAAERNRQELQNRVDFVSAACSSLFGTGMPFDVLLGELNARVSQPQSPPPDEAAFKESFLVAFVVAIGERFNDRLAQSGALVPASKKAKEWIDERVTTGDVKGEDTQRPELPQELDRRGTFSGFAQGASVSLEANAIEGVTRTPPSQTIAAERPAIAAGRTPPPEPPHPAARATTTTSGRQLMRMRMTYARPGVIFPHGQVVSVEQNPDGVTFNVMREDLDPYCMVLNMTREYLTEMNSR